MLSEISPLHLLPLLAVAPLIQDPLVQDPPARDPVAHDSGPPPDTNWPSFRGPRARGVAEGFETPTEWSVEGDSNVLWRTEIPGLAHSSPVVWGDRLFVTSALRVEGEAELSSLYGSQGYGRGDPLKDEGVHAFLVYCLDKRTGEVLWERVAHEGVPRVKRHPKSTHANPTPACDAGHVVAFFASEGLYCYDHSGKLLWKRDLGVLDAGAPRMRTYQWGFASSPVIEGDKVLVQCDVQDQSFIAALDLESGKDVWRTDRDEDPTWCTPTVCDTGAEGRPQVIANGYKHIAGYDLETGEEIWSTSGGGDVPIPTPVVAGDLLYLTSAHGMLAPIRAIRTDARGTFGSDPQDTPQLAWIHPRKGIYNQTPIAYEGLFYACSDGGALRCLDALSGEELYRERLGGGLTGFSGSAVVAGGKLYFSGEGGTVFVVRPGREFELLAENDLGETCLATPAVSAGVLYFRTRDHVLAVGASEAQSGD